MLAMGTFAGWPLGLKAGQRECLLPDLLAAQGGGRAGSVLGHTTAVSWAPSFTGRTHRNHSSLLLIMGC